MENQGMSDPSGPYQVTSSVPYLEEGEELTCRAENAVGGAERTYPPPGTVWWSYWWCVAWSRCCWSLQGGSSPTADTEVRLSHGSSVIIIIIIIIINI